MGKLILIALLVGIGLLYLRRRGGPVNAWDTGANTPNGGSTYGTLETYFAKIAEFDDGDFDAFFVSATAVGSDHLIQMSAGTDRDGAPFYEFDMPMTRWSNPYVDAIEAEGRDRQAKTVRTDDGPLGFVDVSFPTRSDHQDFANWVVVQVFDLPQSTQYEITWG